jgi:hypothetical protein
MSTGLTASGSHFGVIGESSGTGVAGSALGVGVSGSTEFGIGVFGSIAGGSSPNTAAVYGANNSGHSGPDAGIGVYGYSLGGNGLVGVSTNQNGIIGYGLNGVGVWGQTDRAESYGVFGHNTAGGPGVVGQSAGYAGVFAGAVYVAGSLTVTGAKSAAVPHPDGSLRRLYCLESPEAWFEDFGKGQLECGRAEVTIHPDFAVVADLADYHVFLTAYDGDCGLHVLSQTSEGFTVQARDATTTGRFSWRVVAKRKDVAGTRLEQVEPAALAMMAPVKMPKLSWDDGATKGVGVSVRQNPDHRHLDG